MQTSRLRAECGSAAEDVVPRLLASPEQSPEQVASAAIAALQPEEAAAIGDEFVETTLDLFDDVFDVVTNDDPLGWPALGPLQYETAGMSGEHSPLPAVQICRAWLCTQLSQSWLVRRL